MKASKGDSPYFRKKQRFDRKVGILFAVITVLFAIMAAATMILKWLTEGEQTVSTVYLFEMPLSFAALWWSVIALGVSLVAIKWGVEALKAKRK